MECPKATCSLIKEACYCAVVAVDVDDVVVVAAADDNARCEVELAADVVAVAEGVGDDGGADAVAVA
jgi:hypothetical protein